MIWPADKVLHADCLLCMQTKLHWRACGARSEKVPVFATVVSNLDGHRHVHVSCAQTQLSEQRQRTHRVECGLSSHTCL